jgi:hypothetical protein
MCFKDELNYKRNVNDTYCIVNIFRRPKLKLWITILEYRCHL